MIYEVNITEQAETDLQEIYKYIALELCAPAHAEGQINRLEAKILKLSTFPYKYREYEEEPWKSMGVRKMPVDNYVVFYIPDDDTASVTVIRIMYNARDVKNQL